METAKEEGTLDPNEEADKTGKENEEDDFLADIPTEGEEEEDEGAEEEDKEKKSEIAQKIRWREKYERAMAKLKEAEEAKIEKKEPDKMDDKEALARKYIKDLASEAYRELREAEKKEEEKIVDEFEDKVETVLEKNPDIDEEDLLSLIEESIEKGVPMEPEVAAYVLKNPKAAPKKEKPKLPEAKRGSGEPKKEEADDSGKSMFQIAQDIIRDIKGK